MSWKLCKLKWQSSPEGKRFKDLTGKEIFEIDELKDICERFKRGYYTDDQFKEILVNEIQQLEIPRV